MTEYSLFLDNTGNTENKLVSDIKIEHTKIINIDENIIQPNIIKLTKENMQLHMKCKQKELDEQKLKESSQNK